MRLHVKKYCIGDWLVETQHFHCQFDCQGCWRFWEGVVAFVVVCFYEGTTKQQFDSMRTLYSEFSFHLITFRCQSQPVVLADTQLKEERRTVIVYCQYMQVVLSKVNTCFIGVIQYYFTLLNLS